MAKERKYFYTATTRVLVTSQGRVNPPASDAARLSKITNVVLMTEEQAKPYGHLLRKVRKGDPFHDDMQPAIDAVAAEQGASPIEGGSMPKALPANA